MHSLCSVLIGQCVVVLRVHTESGKGSAPEEHSGYGDHVFRAFVSHLHLPAAGTFVLIENRFEVETAGTAGTGN